MFFDYLYMGKVVEDYSVFYEKKKQEKKEWEAKDLVVDTRETWKNWANR